MVFEDFVKLYDNLTERELELIEEAYDEGYNEGYDNAYRFCTNDT